MSEQKTGSGRQSYSFVKQQARRDKRRQEAEARDREYQKLSIQERITIAETRRGLSKRELARLAKLLKPAKKS